MTFTQGKTISSPARYRAGGLLGLSLALLLTACGASNNTQVGQAAGGSSPSASPSASVSATAATSAQPSQKSTSASAPASSQASAKPSQAQEAKQQSSAAPSAQPSTPAPSTSAQAQTKSSATPAKLNQQEVVTTQDRVQEATGALAQANLAPLPAPGQAQDAQASQNLVLDADTQAKILEVATGAAADEYLALAYEYAQNGWTVTGTPSFVGEPKITNGTVNGKKAMILDVCVDSSKVIVTNSSGQQMTSSTGPKRTRTFYTLIEMEGTWKISTINYPDNPDC